MFEFEHKPQEGNTRKTWIALHKVSFVHIAKGETKHGYIQLEDGTFFHTDEGTVIALVVALKKFWHEDF